MKRITPDSDIVCGTGKVPCPCQLQNVPAQGCGFCEGDLYRTLTFYLDGTYTMSQGIHGDRERRPWREIYGGGAAPKRTTPEEWADCDQVRGSNGSIWAYSEPSDTWKMRQWDGTVSLASARSWQRLQFDFGPLARVDKRLWPDRPLGGRAG